MLDQLAIIGGCGSSGTTLLCHLLHAHPDIYCGPELYLFDKRQLYTSTFSYTESSFEKLMQTGLRSVNLLGHEFSAESTGAQPKRTTRTFLRHFRKHNLTKEEIRQIAAESSSFQGFVTCIGSVLLTRTQKRYWVEKTPNNCYCIDEFLSFFPNSRYIHMVRDGRDVVPSLLKRGLTLEQATRRWIHDTATVFPHRRHPRCLIVRYEDLVTATEPTLSRLLEFLDLSTYTSFLLNEARKQPIREKTHNSWNSQPNQKLSTRSVGKWKKDTYQDKAYLEQLFNYVVMDRKLANRLDLDRAFNANDVLIELGYDPIDVWDVSPNKSYRLLKHSYIEWLHRLRNINSSALFRVLV